MGLMGNIDYYYYDSSDLRTRDWLLLDSIWYPIVIVLIYLLVVLKVAPAYMKNLPAYKLNTFIKFYNLFQVFANGYIIVNLSSCYPFLRAFECRPIVYSTDACGLMAVKCTYYFMWLKLVDFTETMVFILRKKNNQASFLHIHHHVTAYWIVLLAAKYFTSEVTLLGPILNCSVHVIMYSYYFLSNFQGQVKQMIFSFKPYLTLIQMGQFIILMVQSVLHLILSDCVLLKLYSIMILYNVSLFFWLFYRFYQKSYIDSKKKRI